VRTSWHAHLPSVAIDGVEGEVLGPGRVERLPFREWGRLDPTFPWAQTKYEASAPVFWVGEADLPSDIDAAHAIVSKWIERVHLAMLLDDGAPLLPAPTLSVTYLSRGKRTVAVRRYVGLFQREWIVFAREPQLTCDRATLARAQSVYDLLERAEARGFPAGVESSLHALLLTMRPEFWFGDHGVDLANSFVHSIVAAEGLLMPARSIDRGRPGLTVTFGRHAAVLAAPTRDDLERRAADLSQLYRLRSRLLHGEQDPSHLDDDALVSLDDGISFFRFALRRAVALGAAGELDDAPLAARLAAAWSDPQHHAALFQFAGPT